MAIVEINTFTRPNTSVQFVNEVVSIATESSIQALLDGGNYTKEISVSGDGLTQTQTRTYDTLETFSAVMTARGFRMKPITDHVVGNDFAVTYSLTGIDQTFNVTTTYTFPTGTPVTSVVCTVETDTYFGKELDLEQVLQLDLNQRLYEVSVNGNTITAVHQYANGSDYVINRWKETGGSLASEISSGLIDLGVTKTIQFNLV